MFQWKRPPLGCVILLMIPLALIALIALSVINSFYGNRATAARAGRQMSEYVQQTYPQLKLTLSEVTYNLKTSDYSAVARSTTSPDTWFTVEWRRSRVIFDNYQQRVLGGINTLERLGREMNSEIEPLLKGLFGDPLQHTSTTLIGREKVEPKPPLDTPFSRDLRIPATIDLTLVVADPTLEDAAKTLQQADALLKSEGYTVRSYRMELRDHDVTHGYDITIEADRISDKLAEELTQSLDDGKLDEQLHVSRYRQSTELWEEERRRRRRDLVVFIAAITALIALLTGVVRYLDRLSVKG